jgi:hypothetical protein
MAGFEVEQRAGSLRIRVRVKLRAFEQPGSSRHAELIAPAATLAWPTRGSSGSPTGGWQANFELIRTLAAAVGLGKGRSKLSPGTALAVS